jgi:hypothetical protein
MLEITRTNRNSLETEIMGVGGLTAGCNAVGGMEKQVVLFNTVPVIFINSLRFQYKPHIYLMYKLPRNNCLHLNSWHQKAASLLKKL